MRTADFDYDLPPELIAQAGIEPRDAARLLVADRHTGTLDHRHVRDLPDLLRPGDLLVANDSRVLPARLFGYRAGLGVSGRVELLLLRRLDDEGLWECLARPARRLRPGGTVMIEPRSPEDRGVCRAVVEAEAPGGVRHIRFDDEAMALARGHLPLPPYVTAPQADPERYQTVYARDPGSAAAPTAGLHFTPELLERLALQDIRTVMVTLHVGVGTFRPVEVEDPADHVMHQEWGELSPATAAAISQARAEGRRIVAIGTTATRVLESAALAQGQDPAGRTAPLAPWQGDTDLFIVPGFPYRVVDVLFTNFHLPRSTLLMLLAAFAGLDLVRTAYATAVEERYRFYSLGDASLWL